MWDVRDTSDALCFGPYRCKKRKPVIGNEETSVEQTIQHPKLGSRVANVEDVLGWSRQLCKL